jgi:RNA polymerase sigma factor (TIGR02999 family)
MAAVHLSRESASNALEPTELVNEVYLHLFGKKVRDFENRNHFISVAARAMRCILIDIARKRKAVKRGFGFQVTLDELIPGSQSEWPERLLNLESALTRLASFDPRSAQIVEMKVFMAASDEEIASVIGKSARTIKRDFRAAKAWLQAELLSNTRPL